MARPQKLELTWLGKDQRARLEPRILLEEPQISYHAQRRVTPHDVYENRLIHGDNLLALKALEQEFSGKIRCIYIDPPYNTGAAFEHYDDGVEHSLWLSLMRDRLELLRRLLTEDGSLWISIDDNEAHYLKVLCDELFGRQNFVGAMIWEKRTTRENRRVFSFNHDYILLYAKNRFSFEKNRNPLPLSDEILARYKNPDNDPRGPWQSVSANAQAGHATASQFYRLKLPSGRAIDPPKGRCWLYTEPRMKEEIDAGNIWFGANGDSAPRIKKFLRDSSEAGLTPETLWRAEEVGTNDDAKKHLIRLLPEATVFDNPKPEGLIKRILQIATNEGDWVLDSFAGSGTTGAVAHKMHRKWLLVELGDHARTHIVPRLRKVIDGEDENGVTAAVEWTGGGGFRFFNIAPSLVDTDRWGNPVINKGYNADMLAEAVCKLEGFSYAPTDIYWQQGYSTECDFIYVTTQKLTRDQLQALSDDVGDDRTLLICCAAFRAKPDAFANLTIKKIPHAVLSRCEWGRDDYSLQIKNLPAAPDLGVADAEPPAKSAKGKAKKSASDDSLSLFDTAPTK